MSDRTRSSRRNAAGRHRRRYRDDVGQQALLLVMAITLIMASFALVMVTQTTQEFPVVDHTLVDHAAYRALQAGVNDYLYAINENPNGVTCTSATAPSCAYFQTQGFQFDQFESVPNTPTGQTGTSYAPSEWTSVGYPVINQSAGTIQVAVVGAAGFANVPSSVQYQTANIVFKAANTFLLNVSWSQYNAIDPTILINGHATGCTPTGYLWSPSGSCGVGDAGELTPAFPYYGPVFTDDEELVCNTPTIQQIETAAPNLTYAAPGCQNNVTYLNPSKNLSINPYPLNPPTNINALSQPAQSQGCYYTGPTTITFNSTGYYVSSPDTTWQASNGTTNTTYDSSSLANNKSQCLPSASGSTSGNVSGPSNGVIYVAGVAAGNCTAALQTNDPNPLYAAYDANGFRYDGEGTSSQCNGDAIVSGAVTGAYTVATANDIMIDGNITYADCPQLSAAQQNTMNSPSPSTSPLGEWPTSAQCNTIAPNTINGNPNLINDTLGLIATNFVSVNNPLVSKNGVTTVAPACGTNGASPAPDCSNPNPIVMASILALQHAFSIPNFCSTPTGSGPLGSYGSIDFYGSLGEKYIDVEECGGGTVNGYGVSYTWDSRLSILSPPEFFTPATPSWITNSFSVTVGVCSTVWPVNTSTCPSSL